MLSFVTDSSQFIFYAVGGVLALFALGFLVVLVIRLFFKKSSRLPAAFQRVVLRVRMSKEVADQQEQKNFTKEKIHEQISQAEEFISSIAGLKPRSSGMIAGRQDHISFEVVFQKGKIDFYVVVPLFMRQYLEEQLHAQFPRADVLEVEDYNIFQPTGTIVGSRLSLHKHQMYPIKTYRQFDSDPMDSVLNTLSKLHQDEGACIQYIIRPANSKWHNTGVTFARELSQGKKMKEALKTATGGGWGIGSMALGFLKFFGDIWKASPDDPNKPKEHHQQTPMEQEIMKSVETKSSKAGLEAGISIIVSGTDIEHSKAVLENISNAFSQYNIYEYGNGFKATTLSKIGSLASDFIHRNFPKRYFVLNTEEVAGIFHFPLPVTETPNINWLGARSAPPPIDLPTEGIIIGQSTYRNVKRDVRVYREDRMRHMYIIGQTGTGKSAGQAAFIIQDIERGDGVCVIDPHGSLIEDYIMPRIPKNRLEDVIYFDPADVDRPFGLNMLEAKDEAEMDFVTQEMIAIFYKLVTDPAMIGPMFEHNMRNAMFTLMADKNDPGSIVDIPRIFTDEEFQKYKVQFVTDPLVKQFWEKEMAQQTENTRSEMLGYLISKVGRFVENKMMRNIIGQPGSSFNVREVMDKQKILLINLSKGKIGDINSNLLGLIIVSKILQAALSRTDMPEKDRKDFYLYIDEFQNYITDSIATILSEARKYRLGLTIAHQYIGQLTGGAGVEGKAGDTKVRDAVFGNVGTIMAFRIGVDDGEFMQKQFAPIFSAHDMINLENFNAVLRPLIKGFPAKPFNIFASRYWETGEAHPENVQIIKEYSRLKYGRPVEEVDAEIMRRSKLGGGDSDSGSEKDNDSDDFFKDFNLDDDEDDKEDEKQKEEKTEEEGTGDQAQEEEKEDDVDTDKDNDHDDSEKATNESEEDGDNKKSEKAEDEDAQEIDQDEKEKKVEGKSDQSSISKS